MSASYTVKTHKWHLGKLHVKEFVYGTLQEAKAFAHRHDCHEAKILDVNNAVVHTVSKQSVPSTDYA